MQIAFDKMQGAGNDFIVIDNRLGQIPDGEKCRLVTCGCRRRFGIGADGMIFIENDPEYDFCWDFYNSDGSKAEMCGNGARCAARFAGKIGAAGESMVFRSLAGPIEAALTPAGAKIRLPDAVLPDGKVTIDLGSESVSLWFLNTGVPHAVIEVSDLENLDIVRLGRLIRNHPQFAPAGTNVNFITPHDGGCVSVRTYERGVEDETMACGTGSVASSLVAGAVLGRPSPVVMRTRGGGELIVHFTLAGSAATGVYLEGGAELVYSGHFTA